MPAHFRAKHGFKHVLLKPAHDRITIKQIQNRRMALDNPGPTILVIVNKLGHVTFAIAHIGQPFGALGDCVSLRLRLERSCPFFKNIVEKFLGSVGSVDFLRRFQQV